MKIKVLENNTFITIKDIAYGDVFSDAFGINNEDLLSLDECIMIKTSYMAIDASGKKRYLCIRLKDGVSFWYDENDEICLIKNVELVIGGTKNNV